MLKNLIVNAGDTGKIPGQGRSHVPTYACAQLLSLCSTTTETRAPQLETACRQQPRPSTAKNGLNYDPVQPSKQKYIYIFLKRFAPSGEPSSNPK